MNGCVAELGQLKAYPTGDGSFSLHSSRFGEAFHNSAGALNEAQAKFRLPAQLHRFHDGQPLRILDVCVGLGYNTAVALEAIPTPSPAVQWWGLELDRRPLQLALEQPNFCALWSADVLKRLIAIRDTAGWCSEDSQGMQLWGDARRTLTMIPADMRFDLILQDAFSPQRCPELWSEEFLTALAGRLAAGGRLLTYSRSAAVRASLQRCNLRLFSLLQAPGERSGWSSGTMAVQPDGLCFANGPGWRPLSAMEQEHLRTRAAVPFRDPSQRDASDAILKRRQIEQTHSRLEATNTWQRRHGLLRSKDNRPTTTSEPRQSTLQ